MNENSMRCDNCKYGYITRNDSKTRITKIECSKFRHDISLNTYKNLRCCMWFENKR